MGLPEIIRYFKPQVLEIAVQYSGIMKRRGGGQAMNSNAELIEESILFQTDPGTYSARTGRQDLEILKIAIRDFLETIIRDSYQRLPEDNYQKKLSKILETVIRDILETAIKDPGDNYQRYPGDSYQRYPGDSYQISWRQILETLETAIRDILETDIRDHGDRRYPEVSIVVL